MLHIRSASQFLQSTSGAILLQSVPRDPDPSPEAELLTKEAGEHIQRAIGALPASLRVVLTMRDVEGLSSKEVCSILRIRETHQRVLLHRARTRVRVALQAYVEAGRGDLGLREGRLQRDCG
jgi:RNA polymerase sigma-70 factor (ECF subfamily)